VRVAGHQGRHLGGSAGGTVLQAAKAFEVVGS
jgi:hypothetical protein